jgi:hypothetical protein
VVVGATSAAGAGRRSTPSGDASESSSVTSSPGGSAPSRPATSAANEAGTAAASRTTSRHGALCDDRARPRSPDALAVTSANRPSLRLASRTLSQRSPPAAVTRHATSRYP